MEENTEDFEIVRRAKIVSNHRTYNNPVLKIEPKGRFLISQKAAIILDINTDDGVMFGFNKKAKTAYITKDNEPDAFIIRRKDASSLRFTSKDLFQYFKETFGIEDNKGYLFDISNTKTEKGFFSLTLK